MKKDKNITKLQTADGHEATIIRKEKYTLCVPIQFHYIICDKETAKVLDKGKKAHKGEAITEIQNWTKAKYFSQPSIF
jgi:hypothetical protein